MPDTEIIECNRNRQYDDLLPAVASAMFSRLHFCPDNEGFIYVHIYNTRRLVQIAADYNYHFPMPIKDKYAPVSSTPWQISLQIGAAV